MFFGENTLEKCIILGENALEKCQKRHDYTLEKCILMIVDN